MKVFSLRKFTTKIIFFIFFTILSNLNVIGLAKI
jgi:hypothetical protein